MVSWTRFAANQPFFNIRLIRTFPFAEGFSTDAKLLFTRL